MASSQITSTQISREICDRLRLGVWVIVKLQAGVGVLVSLPAGVGIITSLRAWFDDFALNWDHTDPLICLFLVMDLTKAKNNELDPLGRS